MFKLIAGAFLSLSALTASAQVVGGISIGLGDQTIQSNKSVSQVSALGGWITIAPRTSVDALTILGRDEETNFIVNRTEIGLSHFYPVAGVVPTFRTSVGVKDVSRVSTSTYYTAEVGVNVPLPNSFFVRTAFRYRDAFDSEKYDDRTKTNRYAIGYNITKKDRIEFNYDDMKGDSASIFRTIRYTRSF
jgi:hypothetical protein